MAAASNTADTASAEPEKLNSRLIFRMTLFLFQTLHIAPTRFLSGLDDAAGPAV